LCVPKEKPQTGRRNIITVIPILYRKKKNPQVFGAWGTFVHFTCWRPIFIYLTMTDLNEKINETFDLAVYLQMMGAFVPGVDFREIKQLVLDTYDFFKTSTEDVIEKRLPELRRTLSKMSGLFIERFPLKSDIRIAAKTWNDLFKNGNEVFFIWDYLWLA
jgi:hypothetical protein